MRGPDTSYAREGDVKFTYRVAGAGLRSTDRREHELECLPARGQLSAAEV